MVEDPPDNLEVIVPTIFLILGTLFAVFPRRSGLIFSTIGRWTWRIGTFGLTDMRWFYPDDRKPNTMRLLGIGWILMAIVGTLFRWLIMGDHPSRAEDSESRNQETSISTTFPDLHSNDYRKQEQNQAAHADR
jgi:hypothetical protein